MTPEDYTEKEKLLRRKHELEWENLNARREMQAIHRSRLDLATQIGLGLEPDPLDVEAATLKERQSRELLDLLTERMANTKPKELPPADKKRFSGTVMRPSAARKVEAFIESQGIGFTEFAIRANTTDRTLRKFRKTGKVRRDIFNGIAKAMGLKPENLLD